MTSVPDTVVWAWEQPQDLRFLDPRRVGVAYLALTLRLGPDGIRRIPRHQPLRVARGARMIAVARIEAPPGADLSERTANAVAQDLAALARPSVAAIQIDFDAPLSARPFYRDLAARLRASLPDDVGLSMTALASWCMEDPWLAGMPVDETVPMLFRMGPATDLVRGALARAGDFPCPQCRQSVGFGTDEAPVALAGHRRVYWFHAGPWTEAAWRSATATQ
jgi:hypothetical protein